MVSLGADAFLLLVGLASSAASGQTLSPVRWEVALPPHAILVGERFILELRLELPEGWVPHPPDTISGLHGIESAGGVHLLRPDSSASGGSWTIRYPLLALRPGYRPLPVLQLRVVDPGEQPPAGGARSLPIPLGGVPIDSRLPASMDGVAPSPPLPPPRRSGFGPEDVALVSLLGMMLSGLLFFHGRAIRARAGTSVLQSWDRAPSSRSSSKRAVLRDRLLRALAMPPDSPAQAREVFEDILPLVRRLLSHEMDQDVTAATTPELLTALAVSTEEREIALLTRILHDGDEARFGGRPPPVAHACRFQTNVRTWLEDGSHG